MTQSFRDNWAARYALGFAVVFSLAATANWIAGAWVPATVVYAGVALYFVVQFTNEIHTKGARP